MGTATKELPACPVETTLTLISDKWKVLILRDLLPGTKRFGELKKSIGHVSQKSLNRSAARDGEQRTSYPNRLCGSSSQGGIYTDGFRVQFEAGSGRHVELGRELQGAKQLIKECRRPSPMNGSAALFRLSFLHFFW